MDSAIRFEYAAPILSAYPDLVGGVIIARNLTNTHPSDELNAQYAAEQSLVQARIGETPLSELQSIRAWRSTFSRFGVSPTQYRNAAESLLRRLTKKGDIPSINPLVDLGNLVSIRYALPVAVFDIRQIREGITVRYADGSESFADLADGGTTHPESGEVIFVDGQGMAVARRWCWRQSATSAASSATTDAIITVEAHHPGARAEVERAVADLLALLNKYARGQSISAILDAAHPVLHS
jgi:DNA/RNA-binding domain of Phe-tRNA-synthetase-like protein